MRDTIRIVYAGGKESQRGVAILLDAEMAKRVTMVTQHNDRLLMVKLQAPPVDMVIIQVYMPTSQHEDEEVDDIYDQIEELMNLQKGKHYMVIMGGWNAVVGEEKYGNEIGQFGLGKRNERGQKLIEFCRGNKWFQHKKEGATLGNNQAI